jgi:hypothetical protein
MSRKFTELFTTHYVGCLYPFNNVIVLKSLARFGYITRLYEYTGLVTTLHKKELRVQKYYESLNTILQNRPVTILII